ncbi:MAG: phenylalanine--tRNA ligase subunit beta [Clostridia bacterium]
MLLSLNWLKKYVNVNLTGDELAKRLTMAGLAVDNVYPPHKIENIIIGKILNIKKHEDSDHLLICSVLVQEALAPIQIVTGASNVYEGMLVPVAMHGAILPDGTIIKRGKLRGVESNGMLCSGRELAIDEALLYDEDKDGIMGFLEDAPIGADAAKYLGLDDTILELDLTPNRADCYAIINVAREVAALLGKELMLPTLLEPKQVLTTHKDLKVSIAAPALCYRYIGRKAENIVIKRSPQWLVNFLRSAGIRPINNIVDITNFVLLEMGQPLHAFDAKLLSGAEILVRCAKNGEKIFTLDEIERSLDEEMLLITDGSKAIAVAGVMGGLNSGIQAETKEIIIEAAIFDRSSIRKTARKLGLHSEAASRYEKGLSTVTSYHAMNRAAALIEELNIGIACSWEIDCYPQTEQKTVVTIDWNLANRVLGTSFTKAEVLHVFARLSFTVEEQGDILSVGIPYYRIDITEAIDLVEEVARFYGFDAIPTTLPSGKFTSEEEAPSQKLEDKLKSSLAAAGLYEIITYSFINEKSFDKLQLAADDGLRQVIPIANPLSEEQGVMRSTLLPGILETAVRNLNKRNLNLRLFEIGRVFEVAAAYESQLPNERLHLACLLSGKQLKTWAQNEQEVDFFTMKGLFEQIFAGLKLSGVIYQELTDCTYLHPGRAANICYQGTIIGKLGEVHPNVVENYGLSQKTYVAELDLQELISSINIVPLATSLPRFQGAERDMAIVLPDYVAAGEVEASIKQAAGEYLSKLRLFDIYQGKGIEPGFKSMAYSLTWLSASEQLTEETIKEFHEKILNELAKQFKAKLR